ncbi:tetratricopeptide repeat protein [Phenylobacterium sp.]|uniref:tetratricopeptide repeat protein n=1 Tax=Phenylobacterium sp. TaxID=1871053 RepID=UPI0025D97C16|nr:tetratricopeptide repeat protein [Phenylobacterium sp.]MBX3482283.1 tetratricopeptide repeat protein [Phenylobacterium sp.]MCW5760749.1 tetratricopeptide repeat protein [Phenylobacterium sp.]
MTDLFEEVEEQLRSDRYKQFARTALPWMLGVAAAALIAVLGYWGWDTFRTRQTDKASEQYAQAMDAFVAGDREGAKTLWTEVSRSRSGAYQAMALMHLAADAERANDSAAAARLYDEAAKAAPDAVLGDAARLKSAFALLDTAPLKDLEGRLKPLMDDGRPYRIQAREALAFAKLKAGDLQGARGDFQLISQSIDAQQGAQARAQAAIGLIDSGSAKSVPAVVRAAQALPPPMPMQLPPGAMPPGAEGQPMPAPQAEGLPPQ